MRSALIAALNTQLLFPGVSLAPDDVPRIAPGLQTKTFGDWAVVCGASSANPGSQVCEVTTEISAAGQTAPFARIALINQEQNRPMRIIAIVPVAVSIAPGVNVAIAPGNLRISLTYKYCALTACFAEAELGEEERLAMFRNRLEDGRLAFSDPTGKEIEVKVSFKGFDQALDALMKQ